MVSWSCINKGHGNGKLHKIWCKSEQSGLRDSVWTSAEKKCFDHFSTLNWVEVLHREFYHRWWTYWHPFLRNLLNYLTLKLWHIKHLAGFMGGHNVHSSQQQNEEGSQNSDIAEHYSYCLGKGNFPEILWFTVNRRPMPVSMEAFSQNISLLYATSQQRSNCYEQTHSYLFCLFSWRSYLSVKACWLSMAHSAR